MKSSLSVFIVTAVALTGCSGKKSEEKQVFSAARAAQLAASGQTQASADHYARLGEMLLAPPSLEYADQMFTEALKLDPNHRRALFYSSFTRPALKFKGFGPRVMSHMTPSVLDKFASFSLEVAKMNVPELSKLVHERPAGTGNLYRVVDVQKFLRSELLPALKEASSNFAKLSQGSGNVELNLNLYRMGLKKASAGYYSSYCSYTPTAGWECHYWSSPGEGTKAGDIYREQKITVDSNDLSVLQSAFQTAVDYGRIYTAFSLEGAELAYQAIQGRISLNKIYGRKFTLDDLKDVLKDFPSLFTLDSNHELNLLAGSLEDTLKNVMQLESYYSLLCNNRTRDDGSNLFKQICVDDNILPAVSQTLSALNGPIQTLLGYDSWGYPVKLKMDLSSLLKNPPSDLKALIPGATDARMKPIRLPDPTLGGLFPDGDLPLKLTQAMYSVPSKKEIGRKANRIFNPVHGAKILKKSIQVR